MNNTTSITTHVEIWQAQTYWPIKGWAAPLSGAPHYSCVLLPSSVADAFPNDLLPPVGWKWADDWALDTNSQFGNPDTEGWFYAASFDRLNEQMRNSSASGMASATCTVRKRRWVRGIVCISSELASKIRERADRIIQIRVNIESSLKNKEASLRSVNEYEENRATVYAQSLHMATQSTLNTLGILKDISNKMKVVKQYISDRALMERDHSIRLEKLALKYLPLATSISDGSITPPPGAKPKPAQAGEIADALSHADLVPAVTTATATSNCTAAADLFFNKIAAATKAQADSLDDYSRSLMPMLSEMDSIQAEIQEILKDARVRFRKNSDICRLSESAILNFHASVQLAFSSVSQAALREVAMLTEELTCLRGGLPFYPSFYEHIMNNNFSTLANPPGASLGGLSLQSQSFIAGASSSAASSSVASSSTASTGSKGLLAPHKEMVTNAMASSAQNIRKATIKLTSKASTESIASTSSLTSSATGAVGPSGTGASASTANLAVSHHNREDFWLSVQRYRVSVRDAQEALAVLISEYMDLELQQQIVTNRAYSMLTRLSKQYAEEEMMLYATLQSIYRRDMKSLVSDMKSLGLPYQQLLSPFDKLNPPSEGAATSEYRDFVNSSGVFAFTLLYRTPLPVGPGVVTAGYLHVVSTADLRFTPAPTPAATQNASSDYIISSSPSRVPKNQAGEFSSSLNWKEVYVVATSDGYVHVLFDRVCDIPDRSFYLRHCILRELSPDAQPLRHHAFEISHNPKHIASGSTDEQGQGANKRKPYKGSMLQGLVFRNRDGTSLQSWINAFHELSYWPVEADVSIETHTHEAMLQSLPILKGETAQIDLEELQMMHDDLGASSTSSDYSDPRKDSDDDDDDAEDGGAGKPRGAAAALANMHGAFSDDESDYPRSAATTPFTPHHLRDMGSPDQGEDSQEATEGVLAAHSTETPETPSAAPSSSTSLVTPSQAAKPRAEKDGQGDGTKEATPIPVRSVRKLSTHFSTSKYEKKEAGSWIRKTTQEESLPANRLASGGMVPIGDIKPVQIIPKTDRSLPLAKRHNELIQQYEKGLQHEKQKTSMKVLETRGQRLKEFGIDELLDANVDSDEAGRAAGASVGGARTTDSSSQPSTSANVEGGEAGATQTAAITPSADTGRNTARSLGVKRLSKMFDANSIASVQTRIQEVDAANERLAGQSTPSAASSRQGTVPSAEGTELESIEERSSLIERESC